VDRYLLPNQAKNRVIEQTTTDFLCLIENDNLVEAGWLEKLIRACEEHPADVAIPLLMEGRPGSSKVHFDDQLGYVERVDSPDGEKWVIRRRRISSHRARQATRRSEEFMETHCLLFRKSVFERIGPFDEELNTSEEVDVSLALYEAGVPAVFEPESVIHYVLPTFPLPDEDRDYFLTKWEVDRARASHARIMERWNLAELPQTLGFVIERNLRGSDPSTLPRELGRTIETGEPFLMVDNDDWRSSGLLGDLPAIPFLERNGEYWGPPADGETAVAELERIRRDTGVKYMVFAWHTRWWLEHYRELQERLAEDGVLAYRSELLTVFEFVDPEPDHS
jgi:hypothetical protein